MAKIPQTKIVSQYSIQAILIKCRIVNQFEEMSKSKVVCNLEIVLGHGDYDGVLKGGVLLN